MIRASLLLGLTAALAACSDGMQVGSVHVKSGSIGAGGGTLTVTAADHPQLAGTTIVVPRDALGADTVIAIGIRDTDLALDGALAHGPSLYFAPIGLTLGSVATVTVPYAAGDDAGLMVAAGTDAGVRDLSGRITGVDTARRLVTFELDTLGYVQPQVAALLDVDGGCTPATCGADAGVDAPCALGACPTTDGGGSIDAPSLSCTPTSCPIGTECTPAGGCVAVCGATICGPGQGCNADDVCVAQCGAGGLLTHLCGVGQTCDFATGTCH